jgi:hypothetical protein
MIPHAGYAVESVGVFIIIAGSIWATAQALKNREKLAGEARYLAYRRVIHD